MSITLATSCSEFHLVVYSLISESPKVLLQFFKVELGLYYSSFSIIRILQLIANDLPRPPVDMPNQTGPHSSWCRNPGVIMSLYQLELIFAFGPSFLCIHRLCIHFQEVFLSLVISNVWWGLWKDFRKTIPVGPSTSIGLLSPSKNCNKRVKEDFLQSYTDFS